MIVVTGAAGFIGANLVHALNKRGETGILAVDNMKRGEKCANLADCTIADYLDKDAWRDLMRRNALPAASAVFHQGACSDTMETDGRYMMDNNHRCSVEVLDWCEAHRVPLVYASSAAVYGASTVFVEEPANERPLNVYGYSKLAFDQHVRQRKPSVPVVGLRYFNVYGPREQHKGRMASVAFHQFGQFRNDGQVRLFEGNDGWGPGEQKRDFIHVDDLIDVNLFFAQGRASGIFNVGTGRAQPFNDVSLAVINAMRRVRGSPPVDLEEAVDEGLLRYIPFPPVLKGKYQSFTQASLDKLRQAGYDRPFMDVAQGVARYCEVLSG